MGAIAPAGYSVAEILRALDAGRCATRGMNWGTYAGMRCTVGAPVELRDADKIPRRNRRTMSRMSIFAVQACVEALASARLDVDSVRADGRIGCIMGSTTGSPEAISESYETLLECRDISMMSSSKFFQCISHTVAMNVSQFLGLRGVVLAPSAACASGLQAVGAGYDLIRLGRQDVLLCGGGEELHPTSVGSFDVMFATSTRYNESPQETPRPFDRDRDGLVCGEGAGVLVLEDRARALARGATIYGELAGYHTCGNGSHVSQSDEGTMVACMARALEYAGLDAGNIDYVNAHATGTSQGDAAEAAALGRVFAGTVPVSSLKGYMGHTLGASGAIELICSLCMARDAVIYPTLHLDNVAPDCEGVFHVQERIERPIRAFLKNSFAFGGINAVLVCRTP